MEMRLMNGKCVGRLLLVVAMGLALLLLPYRPLRGQGLQSAAESDFLSRWEWRAKPFRLIYPMGADSLGRETLRYLLRYEGASRMGGKVWGTFPVILRTGTSVSNGSVGWVPPRMELYGLTSGEASTPVLWLDHLVSHELRHRAQLIGLTRYWNIGFFTLFGRQGIAISVLQTPSWFLEGDAIYNESKLTGYGRANMASTYQQYRLDLLTGHRAKYDQYLYRSLRYRMPNHYDFGSALVEHGVYRHGEGYWEDVLAYVAKYPIFLFPFGLGQKKYGGLGAKDSWDAAMASMDTIFRAHLHGPEDTVPQQRGEYASHRYPYAWQGRNFFWRNTFHERQRLVEQDAASGRERVLYEPHYRMGAPRYDSTLAAWVQLYQHPFWDEVNWGDIWVYDLHRHKGVRLTRRGQYLSPQPRAQGEVVDAIEVGKKGDYRLVRLSLPKDTLLASYRFPAGWELREVVKGLTPSAVLVRAVSREGAMLVEFDWDRGDYRMLLGPVRMDISGVQCAQEGVYFSMSNDYMRRGFLMPWAEGTGDMEGAGRRLGEPQELVLPSYGVEDLTPLPDGRVLYASFGLNGYSVAEVGDARRRGVPDFVQSGRLYPLPSTPEKLSARRLAPEQDSSETTAASMPSTFYSPLGLLPRIHSWFPFYTGANGGISQLLKAAPGLTLLAENHNGSLSMRAAYFYQAGYHGGELAFDCLGMWPRLQIGGRIGGQPRLWFGFPGSGSGDQVQAEGLYLSGNARLSFPVQWGSEGLGYWISPYGALEVNNNARYNPQSRQRYHYDLTTRVGLQAGLSRYMAPRDIFPRWGLEFQGSARFYPVMGQYAKPVFEMRGRVNVPGFWRSHVIRLGAHWVDQQHAMYQHLFYFPLRAQAFNAEAGFTRGRAFLAFDVDYTLPLGYPDWTLGFFLYIKRFYVTVFGQYATIERFPQGSTLHRLVGGDLMMNCHILRTQGEFSTGVRIAGSPWRDQLGDRKGWPVTLEFIITTVPGILGHSEDRPARAKSHF